MALRFRMNGGGIAKTGACDPRLSACDADCDILSVCTWALAAVWSPCPPPGVLPRHCILSLIISLLILASVSLCAGAAGDMPGTLFQSPCRKADCYTF